MTIGHAAVATAAAAAAVAAAAASAASATAAAAAAAATRAQHVCAQFKNCLARVRASVACRRCRGLLRALVCDATQRDTTRNGYTSDDDGDVATNTSALKRAREQPVRPRTRARGQRRL